MVLGDPIVQMGDTAVGWNTDDSEVLATVTKIPGEKISLHHRVDVKLTDGTEQRWGLLQTLRRDPDGKNRKWTEIYVHTAM